MRLQKNLQILGIKILTRLKLTSKKDLEASAIFERSKVVTRFWKFRCMQHDPWNPLREKKKHVKSTHSLFLGSYPKFRDSFGSVDENFNVNEFFKKLFLGQPPPSCLTNDHHSWYKEKKLKRCSSNKILIISNCNLWWNTMTVK